MQKTELFYLTVFFIAVFIDKEMVKTHVNTQLERELE